MFCLNPNLMTEFLKRIQSGDLNPEKLAEMSSEARRKYFSSFLGESNAHEVNTRFEQKMLLKDQQRAMIAWAKETSGIKEKARRDIISRVEKMTEVLNPKTEQAFLEDLAAHKLGVTVTMEEAGKISELAKAAEDARIKAEDTPAGSPERLAWGREQVKFHNYMNDLKAEATQTTLVEKLKNPVEAVSSAAGVSKSLKATGDNSAIFRQGWKAMMTNPVIWAKNAIESFGNIVKTFGNKPVIDELNADILSRPNYELARRAKLAVGTVEEAFPTSLPEKIPLFGRVYKASEVAFTAFVHKLRMDIFDKQIELARNTGVDVENTAQLESIGKMVNALTGRGHLGSIEPVANVVNNVLFSPRFLKSHIDVLTAHQLQKGVTPFVRRQAALNLLKIIGGTATILTIANKLQPGSVEDDPRSANFGKIKIGATRFDVTGGMGSVVTLASRLITHSTKSSTSNRVTKLDSGAFHSMSSWDVLSQFIANKRSPAVSTAYDVYKGKNHDKENMNPLTLDGFLRVLDSLYTPMPIKTFQELQSTPDAADTLLSMIFDALGVSTNSY